MDNKIKFGIIGWALAIILFVLLLQRCGCPECGTKPSTVTTKEVTSKVYDTVEKTINVVEQGPVDSFKVYIPADVDTMMILHKYFENYYYKQTIADTNLSATIMDTLTHNRIAGRSFKYKWLKPTSITNVVNTTVVDTTIIIQPARSFYIGGFGGLMYPLPLAGSGDNLFGIGPQVCFVTKKNTSYDMRYDILGRKVMVGASIRIGRKKK